MSKDDHAIVAGVQHYPALGNLKGPENDAREFAKWLIEKAGVPEKQVHLILSSSFAPFANDVIDAKPTCEAIEREFDRLHAIAEKGEEEGTGSKVGRRLYVFLAGHGFSPQGGEPALLAANATPKRGYHFPGRAWANMFLKHGYFEQIVLLMDCCREPVQEVPFRPPPYYDVTDMESLDRSRIFYGFATKWAKDSREKEIDGRVRGVFTTALLRGLNSEARVGNQITAKSLGDYLYNRMGNLFTPEELADPELPTEPDLYYDPNPNNSFVLATLADAPAGIALTLRPKPNAKGKQVRVRNSMFEVVHDSVADAAPIELQLDRGTYLVDMPGWPWEKVVELVRPETIDVG
jgi:Caspase domain